MTATSTGRERPHRAIAYVPDPTGQGTAGRKREVAGRASAKTRPGLQAFIDRQESAGNVVDVWVVEPITFDSGEQND